MRQAEGAPRRWAPAAPALILLGMWWLLPAIATGLAAVVDGTSLVIADSLRFLVSGGAARQAFRNTIMWVLIVAVGTTVVGVGLAALAERLQARRLLTTVVLVPTVLAPAAVAVIWRSTLAFRPAGSDQVGLINSLVALSPLEPVAWLTQPAVNTVLLAGALVWMQSGVALLVLSAVLARVPDEVRDAARVDGASEFQVFGRITVPSIKGAVLIAGLSGVVVSVRVFDLVKVATDGQYGTAVLGTEMFDQAFLHNITNQGAILGLVMLILVVPVAWLLARRALASRRPEGGR